MAVARRAAVMTAEPREIADTMADIAFLLGF